jgi:hypothetical protein
MGIQFDILNFKDDAKTAVKAFDISDYGDFEGVAGRVVGKFGGAALNRDMAVKFAQVVRENPKQVYNLIRDLYRVDKAQNLERIWLNNILAPVGEG